jgi:hypothetical protein
MRQENLPARFHTHSSCFASLALVLAQVHLLIVYVNLCFRNLFSSPRYQICNFKFVWVKSALYVKSFLLSIFVPALNYIALSTIPQILTVQFSSFSGILVPYLPSNHSFKFKFCFGITPSGLTKIIQYPICVYCYVFQFLIYYLVFFKQACNISSTVHSLRTD